MLEAALIKEITGPSLSLYLYVVLLSVFFILIVSEASNLMLNTRRCPGFA